MKQKFLAYCYGLQRKKNILGKELYGKFDKYNKHLTLEYTIVILPLKATREVTRIVFCTGLIDQR